MNPHDHYAVVCQTDVHAGKWLVVRRADRRIMTEGAVHTCLGWVSTWGPMDQATPKRGRELSPRFRANL